MKRRLIVFSIFSVFALPGLKAQSSDSLKVQNLEEITINAVRASEKDPVSAITVERKDILNVYNGQDGAFLLERLSPSILSYSESGTGLSNYGQMRLRGIDQTRINITLNGVPLNDMIDQGVFFSNFVDFGNSVQSVQIQRGVGTSTNGVASYAGSINFESLSLLNQKAYAEVELTGGSFNTLKSSAEVHTGLMENNTAFYARISNIQSDGYRDNTSTDANSVFFSGGYFGEKHALKFTGFAGRSENGLGYVPVALSDIENNPKTNYIHPDDVDDFGQYLFQLQHTWRLQEKATLSTTAYYGGAGGDFPYGYYDSITFTQINYPLTNRHTGVMLNYNQKFNNDKTDFQTGLHAYNFSRENMESIIPDYSNPYYQDESQKNEVALFAKVNHKLGDFNLYGDVQLRSVQLNLTPDAVFLGMNATIPTREYFFLNPKIGFTYTLNNASNVYASFGRSEREPTRFDILGAGSINAGNLAIAQDVNAVVPEVVNDFEIGWRFGQKNLNLNINGFYMAFENEIAPIGEYIPESYVQVYKNQESSARYGIETVVDWSIMEKLNVNVQGTYMQSNISSYTPDWSSQTFENVSPILSPDLNVRTTLSYSVLNSLELSVSGRYLSESFLDLTNNPDFVVPSSMVFNAMVNWKFYKEHSFALQLNNLTNELYYTYGAPVDVDFDGLFDEPGYFVQAPFHVYASLNLHF